MKAKTLSSFFQDFKKGKTPSSLVIQGENSWLENYLKDFFKKNSFEWEHVPIGTSTEASLWEASCSSMGLFSQKKVLWTCVQEAPSKWKKPLHKMLESWIPRSSAEELFLIFHFPSLRHKVPASWKIPVYSFELGSDQELFLWLQKMNQSVGSERSDEELRFLMEFSEDLSTYYNWLELWSLGGADWASRALGWGLNTGDSRKKASTLKIFDCVDALLQGRRSVALQGFRHHMNEGQEPIQIFALIAKSLRILAQLQRGHEPKGQAPFLVQKLKRIDARRFNARNALKQWVQADFMMKTGASKPQDLLEKFIFSS